MIGRIGKSSEIDDKVEVLVEGSNWKWPSSHVWQDIIIPLKIESNGRPLPMVNFPPNPPGKAFVIGAPSSNGTPCFA
jgi:hypothetical protein